MAAAVKRRGIPKVPTHFQLIDVWSRVLGRKACGIDENFFDLGGHSLLLATMMQEVERTTGKYVSIVRFLERPTIRHLAECLAEEARRDDVALIQRGREGVTPLFYFHGDVLGGGFYARQLAAHLGAEQPVYSISPIHLDGNVMMPTVEEIARDRVKAVRRHCARGPYILGGFCIGALTAYEVARQLAETGEEVKGVVLVNPQLAGKVLRSHLRLVQQWAQRRRQDSEATLEQFMRGHRKLERLREVWNAPLREKAGFVLRNGKKIVKRERSRDKTASSIDNELPVNGSREDRVLSAFEWIATAHVPKPCEHHVSLFLTEDQKRATPFLVRKWRKAAHNLDVHHIPGDHLTCITTFARTLGRKLRNELTKFHTTVSLLCGFQFLFEF